MSPDRVSYLPDEVIHCVLPSVGTPRAAPTLWSRPCAPLRPGNRKALPETVL